jgi:hypothetical protein
MCIVSHIEFNESSGLSSLLGDKVGWTAMWHVVYIHSYAVCCVARLWMPSSGRFTTVLTACYQLISILLKQDVLRFRGAASRLAHLAEE